MESVFVSQNNIAVCYSSDSESERIAIEQCFAYYWDIGTTNRSRERWSVVSSQTSSIDKTINPEQLSRRAPLFKDKSVPMAYIDDKFYYSHKVGKINCVTSFDIASKTIGLLRESDLYEHAYIRNLVREPIAAQYKEAGYVLMHASSCSIGESGILVPGLKGAGKSTLLMHLLGAGANFIANDAVMCRCENGLIILTAYPQCVRLSEATVKNNVDLAKYFKHNHNWRFIENKMEFLPVLLDEIFDGHQLSAISKLKLIVVPSLDISINDYCLKTQMPGNIKETLRQSLFHPAHNYIWSPPFEKLNDPAIDQLNLANTFEVLPKICYLQYGILNDYKQKKLFDDIYELASK